MAGDTYLPFLLANAHAGDADEGVFSLELSGQHYAQDVFRYQIKCLRWLQSHFAGLDTASQATIRPLLSDTGCLEALEET